jgi:hypothetical protein
MSRLFVSGVVVAALTAVMTPAPAGAITYDKLAYLTFNGPVQVPGVVLNAGTYRFRLANSETSRNVIQVLSHDGSTVYAMFHTIPDGRMTLTAEPLVTFRETPAGVPVAVKSLFYGHEYRGYEFVYPEGGPIMTAEVAPQPEIWYLPGPAAAVAEPIAEAEIAPMLEPEAELAQAPVQEPAAPPAELPRTASPLPLFAWGGLTSLFAGLGLGLLRRHVG